MITTTQSSEVPRWHEFMEPSLRALATAPELRSKDVADRAADSLGITEAARKASLASGGLRYRNRAGWAQTHLVQAGLIARPRRGVLRLTEAGRALLDNMPPRLDPDFLKRYPRYSEFIGESGTLAASAVPVEPDTVAQEDPQELMEAAVTANRSEVESELLTRVKELTPDDFERLVVKLLIAMGYGTSDTAEVTGGSGDEGIDGIISRDALGLDRVYMQAKRYTDNAVGPDAINAFFGALQRKGADRGVFITSSIFTSGARRAEADFRSIILIDGQRLAVLMSQYGVGVEVITTHQLQRVNEDFFDDL